MRDPARIDEVLAAIHELWMQYPDLRLGQLIVNAVGPAEPCAEVYSIEDTKLLRKLATLKERLRRPPT
jgi:hypothetical protein